MWPSAQIEGGERRLGRCLKQEDKVRRPISESGKVVFERISQDFWFIVKPVGH